MALNMLASGCFVFVGMRKPGTYAVHLLRSNLMRINGSSIGHVSGKFSQLIACLILSSLIALPFAGCSDSGNGTGPLVSSLPTPTNATDSENTSEESTESQTPDLSAEAGDPPLLLEQTSDANSSTDLASAPDLAAPEEDSIASLIDAPQEKPAISIASTPTGAAASLTWQPVADPKVKGYYVYYGKQSSGEPGVCSYDDRIAADTSPVTIAELEPNTPYFFAVSAYGRLESPCSGETSAITPPAGA